MNERRRSIVAAGVLASAWLLLLAGCATGPDPRAARPPGGLKIPMLSAEAATEAFATYFALPLHRAWAWNSAGPYFVAHGHPSRELAGLDAMGQCQADQIATTRGTCSLFLLDDDPQWLFHPVTGRPIDPLVARADDQTLSLLVKNFRREYSPK
jgi:hypothetical protein